MSDPIRSQILDCATRVGSIFDLLFDQIEDWRSTILALPAASPPGKMDSLVQSLVVPSLMADDPILIGAGLIAAPQYLHSDGVHVAWWLGPLESNPLLGSTTGPTRLDLSTRGYAEYVNDLRTLEWYSVPESTRQTHITGPYVDHLCMVDYILTLTIPAEVEGSMLGVVGADIYVKRLERELLPLFTSLNEPVSLLNQVGRVIVSTDPTLAVGTLIPDGKHPVGSFALQACPGTPFSLAVTGVDA
ncbi:MAG: cache domain-containing protein [Lacisediminihabitans sp.]